MGFEAAAAAPEVGAGDGANAPAAEPTTVVAPPGAPTTVAAGGAKGDGASNK